MIRLFHAADSLRLLNEINKEAARIDIVQQVLIEVNVSGCLLYTSDAADE